MNKGKPLSATALIAAKKRSVFRFISMQVICIIVISLAVFFTVGRLAGFSFFLGGFCSVLPSVYMGWRVFGYKGTRPAQDVVKTFYRGEAGKLAMTVVLLSLVFLLVKPLAAGVFFAGFGIAILSHWLSPLMLNK